jgi:hypothetical protein
MPIASKYRRPTGNTEGVSMRQHTLNSERNCFGGGETLTNDSVTFIVLIHSIEFMIKQNMSTTSRNAIRPQKKTASKDVERDMRGHRGLGGNWGVMMGIGGEYMICQQVTENSEFFGCFHALPPFPKPTLPHIQASYCRQARVLLINSLQNGHNSTVARLS